ncbi:4'-phosphopantetheinyl transferase superfamily protein [Heyndrickxia sporothermodurans]|uniref:4'-phosphopantetheinyl transferase family protein n=1 Tax=Heyndrickxia sporothermodurans TaxID=46224 RepID=UPI002E1CFE67|nr:4'-phosphopantetheinyl transferase superfamily protein [Heyndrickxia sporothermodurans]MED3781060.1 4'-phosphopantetheinyl transferase superfamily protein [Heyndrickxia sporothermodurans]
MIEIYIKEIGNAESFSEKFVRGILSGKLNVNGSHIKICKNEFGKPYLRDYPNVHYNISHTRGIIVCAVSDMPVGIDIEKIKAFNKRVPERFFTKSERNYIFENKDNQDERFAEIWTMKESYVKWVGKGMAISFDSFDVRKIIKGNIIIKTKKIDRYILSVCFSHKE